MGLTCGYAKFVLLVFGLARLGRRRCSRWRGRGGCTVGFALPRVVVFSEPRYGVQESVVAHIFISRTVDLVGSRISFHRRQIHPRTRPEFGRLIGGLVVSGIREMASGGICSARKSPSSNPSAVGNVGAIE